MNPFADTHNILSEMTNPVDDIRIIARDIKSIPAMSRELLENAANEYEKLQELFLNVHTQLIETQRKLNASSERVVELDKQTAKVQGYSMTISADIKL